MQSESIEEIRRELDAATRLVAHNVKFDLLWLLHYGIDITNYRVYCTQVGEYLLKGQRIERGLSLAQLSKEYGISDKIDKVKTFWDSGYETDEIPTSILLPYCIQDCFNTLAIYQRQSQKIVQSGLVSLATLQFEMSKILATIEYNGMLIDKALIQNYGEEYGQKIDDINKQLYELIRHEAGVDRSIPLNLNSDEQLSACLYGGRIRYEDKETVSKLRKDGTSRTYERKCISEVHVRGLGFRPLPNTALAKEGVYSTSAEVLKSLKCKTSQQRECIKLLIEKSRLSKLKSTYLDGLQEKMQEDGRIHPSMNQTVTRTGRLSSTNPNSQNMPRGNTGPIKKMFISRYD